MTVRERPILFSAPLVRAILEGRKTQTRRVVKPQKFVCDENWLGGGYWERRPPTITAPIPERVSFRDVRLLCPYGAPGDRLWVRECFAAWWDTATGKRSKVMGYRADIDDPDWDGFGAEDPWWLDAKWEPSIHMPRWASRLLLEVTDVRVQRLQDITGNDVEAEGCDFPDAAGIDSLAARWEPFRALWESINGPGSWGANPWVWAITFRRVEA